MSLINFKMSIKITNVKRSSSVREQTGKETNPDKFSLPATKGSGDVQVYISTLKSLEKNLTSLTTQVEEGE